MAIFLLDENLSPELAPWLRKFDYDVRAVRDIGFKGKTDDDIIEWLKSCGAVLITSDLDFGEFFYGREQGSFGVVILRSKSQNIEVFQRILKNLHASGLFGDEDLKNALVLATEHNYRLRKFIKHDA